MFGELLVRPGYQQQPDWSKPFYCEDWQCPALWECRHHFARSYAYAAMLRWEDGKDKTPFHTPDRFQYAAQCAHFERDHPRDWLEGHCEPPLQDGEQRTWCCIGCGMPECPRSSNVVQMFGRGGVA